uniref:Uncharacterized protein n=1 Tax=Pristionchus pacificus TaxID=54126 RepID=A0A2A6D230_PRIPA|eukprot:PDM84333.1 hypothetical protein PRIPAC_33356 [Pristionchus pacificus]
MVRVTIAIILFSYIHIAQCRFTAGRNYLEGYKTLSEGSRLNATDAAAQPGMICGIGKRFHQAA